MLFPLTMQPMEYMYIHTNASYLSQMIQKDSVTEMTQTQPNTKLLKNSTMLSDSGNNVYTTISNRICFPQLL